MKLHEEYILPLPTLVLELVYITACVYGHASSANTSIILFKEFSKTGNNSLYTKISSRENIHPLQPKTSKHLYTPSSQSSHRYQLLDELFITSTNQHLSGELTGREFLGDSIDIFCFALGETCCTQCRDIFGENLGGRRKRRVCLREESSKLCTN